ncbi:MAG TPA: DUF2277 family protein [Acidimicrobiales bacterium]|nr:DUF2277 family protein [Acidimicrobiales bacterium]
MCRSIVVLRGEEPATEAEIEAAARQYVRKVAGARAPAAANEECFEAAVRAVADATGQLLRDWKSPPGRRPPGMAASRAVARSRGQSGAKTDVGEPIL